MADIKVVLPVEDITKSYEVANATADVVTVGGGATIKNAFGNKDNTLVLVLLDCSEGATLTIKAGVYPNATLGDSVITLTAGTNVLRLQDKSRYEQRDGSINLASTGTVKVLATAKRAGYLDAATANTIDEAAGRTLYMDATRYPKA